MLQISEFGYSLHVRYKKKFLQTYCRELSGFSQLFKLYRCSQALTNIDELFEHDEFTAAPDAGWPDMFNSGLFVYKPSLETFRALVNLADDVGSFDGLSL